MGSFFERNTTLKIISIIIALILWGMTPNNRDPVRDMSFRDIPIKIENQQKLSENGLMISSEMPDSYSFDIRAKGSMVKFLDRSKIVALVNLSDINKTGEQSVSVELQGLPGTSNIEIKSAPDIKIDVERIVSKSIPVLPKIADEDSLELGKRFYEIEPRSVEVRGPESLIATAAYGQVSVSLGDKDKKLERSSAVQLFNDEDEALDMGFITINPEYCVVTIYPNKTVGIDAVITGKPADGFVVMGEEVKPREVTISGNPEVLEAMDSIQTEILDIEGATSNIVKEVRLQQQEDIRVSPGEPSTVQILVRIEKIVDKQVSIEDVEFRNIAEGVEANVEEDGGDISLTIRGPQSLVNAFGPEDLRLYVDLNESSRGGRTYPILVDKLPSGLEIVDIEPENLKVIFE
ncbi:MAG TPA: CdaR family protein [Clostridia bacterium]|nr:CdaR family protein [Clostridia bacterium]